MDWRRGGDSNLFHGWECWRLFGFSWLERTFPKRSPHTFTHTEDAIFMRHLLIEKGCKAVAVEFVCGEHDGQLTFSLTWPDFGEFIQFGQRLVVSTCLRSYVDIDLMFPHFVCV